MINLGSTLAFLVIPWVRLNWGYSWAFGIPGVAMGIATLVFWLGTPHYDHVPPQGDPAWRSKTVWILAIVTAITLLVWLSISRPEAFAPALYGVIGAFVLAAGIWTRKMLQEVRDSAVPLQRAAFTVWWFAVLGRISGRSRGLWDGLESRFTPVSVDHGVSFGRILSIFALIPIFWALFDQTFSTWVLQGEQMTPMYIGSYRVGPEEMLSANPILVLILIPFTTLVLYPALGRLATPLRRMSFGMFLTAFSYVVVAWLQQRLENGESLSIAWQIVPYIILTTAEVLVSTTGLEFAFTQAAPAMKSTITGYWQLTVAAGNLIVIFITTALGGHDSAASVTSERFMLYAGLTLIAAVLFSLIATRYRYREVALPVPAA
jgi:POT family proton-dependent oligopeptide transporter